MGDPWGARSLEWSIPAPPPEYNFAVIPHVSRRDAWHWRKHNGGAYKPADHYRDIAMPKNSIVGPAVGLFSLACSFGLVWHIWWMASGGLFMVWMVVIGRSFLRHNKKVVRASEVEATDRRWIEAAWTEAVHPRSLETTPANAGLAELHA